MSTIQLDALPLADLVAFLEANPPNLPYTSLSGKPSIPAAPALTLLWDTTTAGLAFPTATIVTPTLASTYKHLRVEFSIVNDTAVNKEFYLQINGDSGTNYDTEILNVNATTATGTNRNAQTLLYICNCSTGFMTAGTIDIPNYTQNLYGKPITSQATFIQTRTAGQQYVQTTGSYWHSAAVVQTLAFSMNTANFVAGTRVSVYGLS